MVAGGGRGRGVPSPAVSDPLAPTAELLRHAYRAGVFAMSESRRDRRVDWYDPDPRGVIYLRDQDAPPGVRGFRVRRSLRQALARQPFDLRIDTCFARVIDECARPRPDLREPEPETWISRPIRDAFIDLAAAGDAHCVEAWRDDRLVGGLYGVRVGGVFCGESMFSRVPFASQACLVDLVARLRSGGFGLLDTQFVNPHLAQFGAVAVPRATYRRHLAELRDRPARWPARPLPPAHGGGRVP